MTTPLVLHLVRSLITSCGCTKKTMGGEANTRLGRCFRSMHQRCYLDSYIDTDRYIGKGITVCPEWKDNWPAFKKWSLANGYARSLQLDRINNKEGYSPDNCRWVNNITNVNNRDCTVMVEYKGETIPFAILLREKGLIGWYVTIRARIKRGYTVESAIEKPIRQGNYKRKIYE